MHKLCLSGFCLVALFCCLVAPPFAVYDSVNKMNDKSERSSLIWQSSTKECLLCQKRPKDSGGNISNLTKHVTVHNSRHYQNLMINFHRRTRRHRRGQRQRRNMPTTRERVLAKYSTMSKQWTSNYSRSESPSVAESTTAATGVKK